MSAKTINSQTVSKIFKSRKIILEQLSKLGYDVSDYDNFSINEIAILSNNKQLDLLLKNPKTNKKVFVKYHLGTKLRNNHVYDYIEDLFIIDSNDDDEDTILTKNDDLIIITKEKLNDNLTNFLNILYKKDGYYVNVYDYHRYLYNILDNELQPEFNVLLDEEKEEIKKKYNILNDKQFPEISRFDPVAVIFGIRPGQVFEITRSSPTSIKSKYYRICI